MKLTPEKVDKILFLIGQMRGEITQKKIHNKVESKVVKISSKQLFKHPLIHAAYQDKAAAFSRKRETDKGKKARKAPKNAAVIMEEQQKKIAQLEEKLDVILSNAVAQGVDPRLMKQPLNVSRLGNTYPEGRRK